MTPVLRQEGGRPVIDKTNLEGLFDFKLQFSPERMTTPAIPGAPLGPGGGATGPAAAPAIASDPVPTLLTLKRAVIRQCPRVGQSVRGFGHEGKPEKRHSESSTTVRFGSTAPQMS